MRERILAGEMTDKQAPCAGPFPDRWESIAAPWPAGVAAA